MPYSVDRILLVDDDPDVRYLLCALLRNRGFLVESVDTARECLDHLAHHPVQLVITDVEMPDMSGIELCRQLREHYPHVVPIVISGQTSPPTMKRALETGAHSFLRKPVRIDELTAVLLTVQQARAT